jgi:tRNA 5-methylaminomethyl-2-thiouridine biosynthesis bifunctional protein
MADQDFQPLRPARLQWQEDTPVAPEFDDGYFSRENGPAESRHVFLRGNDLASRFSELPDHAGFVIGETGFGTGLNMLCAAALFLELAPASARLDLVSVEKHPLRRDDLRRALTHWPALKHLSDDLLTHWPAATPGFHRIVLGDGRIRLTLLHGEATGMLRQLHARVDAWFLDGFAPARNPSMWQPALFEQIARLSRPGATLATFTAAGFVRRGLQAVGFYMSKRPGFGRKRDMLTGVFGDEDWQASVTPRQTLAVVGAGLAGATVARALAERGHQVQVLDHGGPASGASGNLAGVVYTTASAHPTPQNRFYQSSFVHAGQWFRRLDFPAMPDHGALTGVLQLPPHERGARKMQQALDSGLWPDELMRRATGRPPPASWFPNGGYLSPTHWIRHLLDHPGISVMAVRVSALREAEQGWYLETGDGEQHADAVILANAAGAHRFAGLDWLPLRPIRGQVSYCRATDKSRDWRHAICHEGYLTPALQELHCVGATFDLHDPDPAPRAMDDQRNLAQLKDNLPEYWQALGGPNIEVVDRRVAFRCQSPDFLPVAGEVPDPDSAELLARPGLYLSVAHGSRGITGTPLCAELIASQIDRSPLPVDRDMLDALQAKRFIVRQRRKNGET